MSRIRWVFLLFIVALSATAVLAAWSAASGALHKTYALLATGLFAASMFAIWTGFYTRIPWRHQARITGHAALMLCAGVAFVGFGHGALVDRTCPRVHAGLHAFAMRHDLCIALSVALIALGLLLGWPSAKLFGRLASGRE